MYQKNLKPLTLREALIIHEILGEYLPEIDIEAGELDLLDYSQKIINSIIADGNPQAFSDALSIMSKQNMTNLFKINGQERLLLFMECVGINQLWRLNKLLRDVGYGSS